MVARLVLALALCTTAGSLAAPATTQSAISTVTGIVIDEKGAALAECVVSATESAQRMRVAQTVETDKDGKFAIDLPEGSWNLTASTKDTRLKVAKSVDVAAGKTFDVGKITARQRRVGAR